MINTAMGFMRALSQRSIFIWEASKNQDYKGWLATSRRNIPIASNPSSAFSTSSSPRSFLAHDLDDRWFPCRSKLLPQARCSYRIAGRKTLRRFKILSRGKPPFVSCKGRNFRDSTFTWFREIPREVSGEIPSRLLLAVVNDRALSDERRALGWYAALITGRRMFGSCGRMSIGRPSQSGHRNERQSSGGNGSGTVTGYVRIWIARCQLVD